MEIWELDKGDAFQCFDDKTSVYLVVDIKVRKSWVKYVVKKVAFRRKGKWYKVNGDKENVNPFNMVDKIEMPLT